MWFFKKRSVEPCLHVGQYSIDMPTSGIHGLIPLTPQEAAALGSVVQFKGEQILQAPDTHFMDHEWNIILGVVKGKVYKVAAQWTGPRAEAGKINRQLVMECTKLYGKGKNLTLWDASDGNVVLESTNMGGEAMVNVFATSSNVRSFERVEI